MVLINRKSIDTYNMIYHTPLREVPNWICDKTKQSIYGLRVWGYHIEAKIDNHVLNLNSKIGDGYYIDTTEIKVIIKYWSPQDPNTTEYCVTVKFSNTIQ